MEYRKGSHTIHDIKYHFVWVTKYRYLWATGYFCATAGAVTEETIKQYIENQSKSSVNDVFKIED